jgi:SAM-dependent methyltransferase
MARPLTRYLDAEGSYEGFDVMAASIAWCREHITPRFPRFRFQHADVRNGFYNRIGTGSPEGYRFPYDDASFDFVYLASVFTHMLPAERDQYLDEIARVLKPGGTCFITCFLLTDESLALIRAGLSPTLPFSHRWPGCRVHSREAPEAAVAYDESDMLAAHAARGLSLRRAPVYGSWCGRLDGLGYQDMLVSAKGSAPC